MSSLLAAPQLLADAASDLAGLGSTIKTANAEAAAPTTGLLPAAADEISTEIASLFSAHGHGFQRLSAQVAAFHEQFVGSLSASAKAYAAAEANIAQTLRNTVSAPATAVLGHPLAGNAVSGAPGPGGGSALAASGGGPLGQAARSALHLSPTGGALGASQLPKLLSGLTNSAAHPAAGNNIATAIENAYLAIEPWVYYGFELVVYAANYVIPFGLANQILYFYNLFEPMVQSGLFNILDWLSGAITFSQGVANFVAATNASINAFINTEINWFLSFFPPLPPLPPWWPF
ncbi:PE family protein [Mycobacterium conspicuum]|nr:PE family protein [Mycobacterium conspicuum]